ncbi:MAG: hypothetical protein KA447_01980 [Pyrinomonadaceae bacterium]|nr:hypothetical protein [Pyrinomonadaceae bacterium]
MMNSLKSNKVAGILTGLFGIAVAGFGAFGLAMVALQRMMMASAPPAPPHFEAMMRAVHETWITYLPFMIAGGVIFGVAGFYIYRGSSVARRIAQITAVLGIIWIFAYSIAAHRVIQTMTELPFAQGSAFQWAITIVNLILFLAFPVALLFVLSSPKDDPPA